MKDMLFLRIRAEQGNPYKAGGMVEGSSCHWLGLTSSYCSGRRCTSVYYLAIFKIKGIMVTFTVKDVFLTLTDLRV